MRFPSVKQSASLFVLALVAANFVSCGGSGGNDISSWDTLPIGSRLDMNMNETQNSNPLFLTCIVTAPHIGNMAFKGKTPVTNVAFSFQRTDTKAKFITNFRYLDESYIAPGPVTTYLWVQANIESDLDLGEQVSETNQLPAYVSGSCNYTVALEAVEGESALESKTYQGTGSYGINYRPSQG